MHIWLSLCGVPDSYKNKAQPTTALVNTLNFRSHLSWKKVIFLAFQASRFPLGIQQTQVIRQLLDFHIVFKQTLQTCTIIASKREFKVSTGITSAPSLVAGLGILQSCFPISYSLLRKGGGYPIIWWKTHKQHRRKCTKFPTQHPVHKISSIVDLFFFLYQYNTTC